MAAVERMRYSVFCFSWPVVCSTLDRSGTT